MKLSDDQKRYIEELFELLKIPSISADSKFKKDVNNAAKWIKNAGLAFSGTKAAV